VKRGRHCIATIQDVHAWMAVPLILRDQVSGMLVLTSKEESAPGQGTHMLAQIPLERADVSSTSAWG